MARPIPPTPDIETEEELEAFLEYMNKPRTKEEKEFLKKSREIYAKTKMRN
ncbi:MAG: hypothetical protein IJJ11_06865 [Methanosphaera sp.]|nr:hypothetical protein [Methanosphaera sp.]